MMNCLLCDSVTKVYDWGPPKTFLFQCPRCGKYILSEFNLLASDISSTKNGKEIISYWVRKNQSKGKDLILEMQLINNILKDHSLPKPIEQVNNLIFWLGEISENPHEQQTVNISNLIAIIVTIDVNGVYYVLEYVVNQGLIESETFAGAKLY